MTTVTQKMPELRLPDLVTPLDAPSPRSGPVSVPAPAASPAQSSRGFIEVQRTNKKIKIIVVADLICVWCYIAFKELNQAIDDLKQAYPSTTTPSTSTTPTAESFNLPRSSPRPTRKVTVPDIDIEYRPFFINTTAGSQDEPIDRLEYLQSRFGKERMTELHETALNRGKEVGIDFKFNAKMRQTTRVHRLLYLAYKRGGMPLQQHLLSLLFRDFFEQPDPFSIDVTSISQLASYAVEIGLIPDKASAEAWLKTRAGEEDVRRLAQVSADCGISGVPFTVVEGKWAIGGGMERGIYYKTLERLITSTAEESPAPSPKPVQSPKLTATKDPTQTQES